MVQFTNAPIGQTRTSGGANAVPRQSASIGGAVAEQVSRFADQQLQELDRQNAKADRLKLSKAKSEFQAKLNRKAQGLDPRAEDFTNQLEQATTDAQQEAFNGVTFDTDSALQEANAFVQVQQVVQRENAIQRRNSALDEQASNQAQRTTSEAIGNIQADPLDPSPHLDALDADLDALGVPDAEKEKRLRQARQQSVVAEAEARAEAGDVARAKEILNSNSELLGPEFSAQEDRIDRIGEQRENERIAEKSGNRARVATDVRTALAEGDVVGARRMLNEAQESGVFEGRPEQFQNLRLNVNQVQAQQRQKDRSETNALARLDTEGGRRTFTQNEVDETFGAVRNTSQFQDADEPRKVNLLRDTASVMGNIPSNMGDVVERANQGAGDIETMANAGQVVALAKSAGGDVQYPGSGNDGFETGEMVAAIAERRGVSYTEAATIYQANIGDVATLKARQEKFEKEVAPSTPTTDVLPDQWDGVAGADDQRRARRAFKRHYALSGDAEAAKQAAKRELRRRGTRTTVNGRDEIMRNPPSDAAAQDSTAAAPEGVGPGTVQDTRLLFADIKAEGDGDAIDEAIRATWTEELETATGREFTDEQRQGVEFVEDEQTAEEAQDPDAAPTYRVVIPTADGAGRRTLVNESGDPVRVETPSQAELMGREPLRSVINARRGESGTEGDSAAGQGGPFGNTPSVTVGRPETPGTFGDSGEGGDPTAGRGGPTGQITGGEGGGADGGARGDTLKFQGSAEAAQVNASTRPAGPKIINETEAPNRPRRHPLRRGAPALAGQVAESGSERAALAAEERRNAQRKVTPRLLRVLPLAPANIEDAQPAPARVAASNSPAS